MESFDHLNKLADTALRVKKVEEFERLKSQKKYNEIIEKISNSETLCIEDYFFKQIALNNLTKNGKGVSFFKEALKLELRDQIDYLYQGKTYFLLKKYEKVIFCLKKVLELNPKNIDALNGLGRSFRKLQNYPKAKENFEKVLELNPKNINALNGLGWLFWKLQNYLKAKENFEKVLELNPKNINALDGLGWLFLNVYQFDKAMQYFQKVFRLNPENFDLKKKICAEINRIFKIYLNDKNQTKEYTIKKPNKMKRTLRGGL